MWERAGAGQGLACGRPGCGPALENRVLRYPWGAGAGGVQRPGAEMDLAEDLGKELETTAQEVLGKLRSHTLFQSKWDTAALIIFLIFLGECGLGLWPPSASCPRPG